MSFAVLSRSAAIAALFSLTGASIASAQASKPDKIPPAPIIGLWPDYTYLPERQCHGNIPTEDLNYYLPRARVAMWLPSTHSVSVDTQRQCLVVRVESVDAGRMAELVLRGMAIPRRAVLLLIG